MEIITNYENYKNDIYDTVHMFYPTEEKEDSVNIKIFHEMTFEGNKIINFFEVSDIKTLSIKEENIMPGFSNALEEKRFLKRFIKLTLYQLLSKMHDKHLPWGSLTGIRPTKVAYDLLAEGVEPYLIKETLMKNFLVSEDKARLVEQVIRNQKVIIRNDNLVDIYINIPFCPSRCNYCSFISAEYDKIKQFIPEYLETIFKEIKAIKNIITEKAYIVRSIYVGGGTPSVLSAEEIDLLLTEVSYPVSEITYECGRPDTITKEKLDILKKHNVSRISINPQTFVDATLKRIGRKHNTQDVVDAYKLALNYDFCINMDIIAGLEKESFVGFKKTIQTLLDLAPDNITVHTLTLKKGSLLTTEEHDENNSAVTEKMVTYATKVLMENGYKPYYLYKLKNQSSGLENVGYFRDKLCLFNIDSMEESCSILACGANAISKRIFNLENRIERQSNCKFLTDYIERIDELIEKKKLLFK